MRTTGRLEARGTLETSAIWPAGSADADTLRVRLLAPPAGFRFRPAGGVRFETVPGLATAWVLGRVRRPLLDREGRLSVRIEGVDAPELHYRPVGAHSGHAFRQPFAESAARALRAWLASSGSRSLPCRVVADVDDPARAFDTYGRCVGEVWVETETGEHPVAPWLLRHGWAVPAFYATTPRDKIDAFVALAEAARRARLGLWAHGTHTWARLSWGLRYRSGTADDGAEDGGAVLLPKLFRRLVTWAVTRRAGATVRSFREDLARGASGYWSRAGLTAGRAAPLLPLSTLLGERGYVAADPEDLVFPADLAQVTR